MSDTLRNVSTMTLNSSYFNKKRRISLTREIKSMKVYAVLGLIFWVSIISLFYFEVIHLSAWTVVVILVAILVLNEASIGWIFSIKDLYDLNKDRKEESVQLSGTIMTIKDLDSRYSIFRYEMKINESAKRLWIDKEMYKALKVGDVIKVVYLKRSGVVEQVKY